MSPLTEPTKLTLKQQSVAPLLLDTYSGAAAAYSLRNLSWAYGGPVVRVRRSSDNAEQDFTAAQVTNGTLTTFCGAGNGFVRTWYDQSGNGVNVNQTDTTKQPQIVVNGAVNLLNSKPSIKFDGTNDFLTGGDVLDIGSNSLTAFAFSELGANGTIYGKSALAPAAGRYFLIAVSSQTYSGLITDLATGGQLIVNTAYTKGLFCQKIINGITNKLFVNGNERGSIAMSGYSNFNTNFRFLIGAYGNSNDTGEATGLFLNGSASELVIYHTDQSANQTAIESNINAYYAIY